MAIIRWEEAVRTWQANELTTTCQRVVDFAEKLSWESRRDTYQELRTLR